MGLLTTSAFFTLLVAKSWCFQTCYSSLCINDTYNKNSRYVPDGGDKPLEVFLDLSVTDIFSVDTTLDTVTLGTVSYTHLTLPTKA